jgi:hypothetical protein
MLYSDAMTDGKARGNATWDVVGLGANSVDFVTLLPGYPQPFGSFAKMRIEKQEILCGGQTATAMCACAKLGLRVPASPDDNGAGCGVNWSGAASIWRM